MKTVRLLVLVILLSCIIFIVVCSSRLKNSVCFILDFSTEGAPIEIKSVSYQIKNGEGITSFKPADYSEKNGKITIVNNESIDGGVAFATYVYKIVFLVDGQQVEASYSFIRTNGKKIKKWTNNVCTILTKQDEQWNADITSDNYENIHKNKVDNITVKGIEVEIVERFGTLD